MKRKPIRVDWEALEDAFARSVDDVPEHLDLITGHVLLEGEGEDDEYDDDDFDPHHGPAVTSSDPMRVPVARADTATKLRWLEAFLETDHELDVEIVERLRQAMTQDDAARRLSEILNANADERDAWYAYRSRRLQERIERWLGDHDVEPIDPPPWRT